MCSEITKPEEIVLSDSLRLQGLPTPVKIGLSSPLTKIMIPNDPVPCRRCQKHSLVGDELALISYDPFLGDSPYRCKTPIFVHTSPACLPADFGESGGRLSGLLRGMLLSVRAYDDKHMMKDWTAVGGDALVKKCEQLLGRSDIAYLHLYYAGPGCFAVKVMRAP
ncbi:MAG: hypothetical protein MMC23_008503 [Stictis urceolatum]|nr:hypothetical protein [Stictis urceolata]